MGLNVNSLKFVLLAHARGVSFGRVLMIGRQSFALGAGDLQALRALPLAPALKEGLGRLDAGPDVYAEPVFALCGATTVDSMDMTSYEGATVVHDLNLPVPDTLLRQYDLVFDGGSIEHIFNIPVALRNCMDMLKVGGHYICNTATNNYSGHGFYQISPELFYAVFTPENGFALLDAYLYEENGRNRWYRLTPPADAGRRMTFQNTVPAHLLVLAKKTADAAVFEHFPQQRMYEAAWTDRTAMAGSPGLKSAVFRALRYLPPRIMWFALNTWNVRNRFRRDLFLRVDDL